MPIVNMSLFNTSLAQLLINQHLVQQHNKCSILNISSLSNYMNYNTVVVIIYRTTSRLTHNSIKCSKQKTALGSLFTLGHSDCGLVKFGGSVKFLLRLVLHLTDKK